MAVCVIDIPPEYRDYYTQALANLYEEFPDAVFEDVLIAARPASSGMAEQGAQFSYLYIFFLRSDFEVTSIIDGSGIAGTNLYREYCYWTWTQGETIALHWGAQGGAHTVALYTPGRSDANAALVNTALSCRVIYCSRILDFESVILYPPNLAGEGVALPEHLPTYSYESQTQTLTLYTTDIDGNPYD